MKGRRIILFWRKLLLFMQANLRECNHTQMRSWCGLNTWEFSLICMVKKLLKWFAPTKNCQLWQLLLDSHRLVRSILMRHRNLLWSLLEKEEYHLLKKQSKKKSKDYNKCQTCISSSILQHSKQATWKRHLRILPKWQNCKLNLMEKKHLRFALITILLDNFRWKLENSKKPYLL